MFHVSQNSAFKNHPTDILRGENRLYGIVLVLIPYLLHCPYKSLNSSSEIYSDFTGGSEKVVIAISLARIIMLTM